MDDHCFPDNFVYIKSVSKESHVCVSVCTEQWRQVTCMIWMGTSQRVEMCSCIGKGIGFVAGAAFSAMDVKRKYGTFTGIFKCRKSADVCAYENADLSLIKSDETADVRIKKAADYVRTCLRSPTEKSRKSDVVSVHKHTSNMDFLMSICGVWQGGYRCGIVFNPMNNLMMFPVYFGGIATKVNE